MTKETILQEIRTTLYYYMPTLEANRLLGRIESTFSEVIKQTREETIEKIVKYRDQELIDEEVRVGKDWYEKNYWCNRVLEKLKGDTE